MFTPDRLYDLILLFFSFSFLGWCVEVVLKYIRLHRFVNRGFLIGPYLPIYGCGVTIATLLNDAVSKYDDSVGTAFVVSFLACGALEYLVSLFLEKRFHARWWDYSRKPMNLNGRVWIGNLLLFGIAGTVIVKLIDPRFFALTSRIPAGTKPLLCAGITAVMLTDAVFSHFIMKLLKTGIEHSEADDTETIGKEIREMMSNRSVFHKRFVDAYPEAVYRTERIRRRLAAVHEATELVRREVTEKLAAEKEALLYNIEPASMIKNDIIAGQSELIGLLDEKLMRTALSDEKPDRSALTSLPGEKAMPGAPAGEQADPAAREKELREHIARRRSQLERRERVLTRITGAIRSAGRRD